MGMGKPSVLPWPLGWLMNYPWRQPGRQHSCHFPVEGADKGYASSAFRERIRDMGARPAIPAKRRGGPVACPTWGYRCRHLVENFRARPKEWRVVATRHGKTATSFLAVIHIAAAADWIKP